MKRFRLTPRALKDLDEIADYSLAAWGEQQAERYIADLESRFQWLAENPLLGRMRDDVAPDIAAFAKALMWSSTSFGQKQSRSSAFRTCRETSARISTSED